MGHEPLVEFFRQVGSNAGFRVAVKPRDGLTVNPNSNRKPDLSFNDHLPNSDGYSPHAHPTGRRRRNGALLRLRQPQPEHEDNRNQVQGIGQASLSLDQGRRSLVHTPGFLNTWPSVTEN